MADGFLTLGLKRWEKVVEHLVFSLYPLHYLDEGLFLISSCPIRESPNGADSSHLTP